MNFSLRKNSPEIVQPIKLVYTTNPVEAVTDKFRMYNVELPKFTKEYDSIGDVSGEAEKRIRFSMALHAGKRLSEWGGDGNVRDKDC